MHGPDSSRGLFKTLKLFGLVQLSPSSFEKLILFFKGSTSKEIGLTIGVRGSGLINAYPVAIRLPFFNSKGFNVSVSS